MKKLPFLLLLILPFAMQAQFLRAGGCTDPTPPSSLSYTGTFTNFITSAGSPSGSQSVAISGHFIVANGTVTCGPSGEVSLDNSTFTSSVTLPRSGNVFTLQPIFVYLRIAAGASPGSPTENLHVVCSPATPLDIPYTATISGSGIDTIVAKFVLASTDPGASGWTALTGNPTAGAVSATDTRNVRQVTITSVAGKWIPLSGSSALNSGGVTATNADFTGIGTTLWYVALNGTGGGTWPGWTPGAENLIISNLDPTKLYTIKTFSAQNGSGIGCPTAMATTYITDSTNARVDSLVKDTKNNAAVADTFKNKRPDASGNIRLCFSQQAGGTNSDCNQFGVGNGIVVIKQPTREGFGDDPITIGLVVGQIAAYIKRRKKKKTCV